jgi:predicted TIM-barrel fold metal-dependent hydrolase
VWVAPYYEDDMAMLKDAVGIERLLFGSDFPHTEGLPDPTMFVKDIPTFDDAEVKAIMRDNVLELMTPRPA